VTASSARRDRGSAGPSWLASLLGIAFLVTAGFVFGLVVGVVKEEPELVVGHLAGRGEDVPWSSAQELEASDPGLGAGVLAPEIAGAESSGSEAPGLEPAVERFAGVQKSASASPEVSAPASVAASRPGARVSEPAARPAVSAQPPAAAGQFSVQVGSFAESEGAERVAGELGAKGYPVYVTPAAVAGGGRWRVRVGPVSTRGEAERFAGRLKREEKLPTWVLSEGGG
jgi:DedD protein